MDFGNHFKTTTSSNISIDGENIITYSNFNFVGNQFANPTVNASMMTNMNFDVYVPAPLDPGAQLKITIRDFGPDGADGGGDDSNQEITFNTSTLMENTWVSLDIPLSIANKNNMGFNYL